MKNYETPVIEVIDISMDILTGSCDDETPEVCTIDNGSINS